MRVLLAVVVLLFLSACATEHQSKRFKSDRGFEVVSNDTKSEQRVALVIGNKDYSSLSPLKNPINDARAMRDILSQKKFKVIYLENASQMEMEDSIDKFAYTIKNGNGVGLFYYAGHGMEVDGINYLIPTNARIPSKKYVKSKSVSIDIIVSAMEEAKNRLNILVLDSCRSNPFGRDGSGGLAPINSATGIYVAYATAPHRVAQDGEGNNGLFTSYLVKYINEDGLELDKIFKKVRKAVRQQSSGTQTPWSSSSVDGDFYFTLPTNVNIVLPKPIKPVLVIPPVITSNIKIINYDNGNRYEGEMRNGKKEGQGTYIFKSGEKYVGKWKNDTYNGKGVLTLANGEKYTGKFENGKYEGKGTFFYLKGHKYIGSFKNSKREGQGTFTFSSGRKYVGSWKNDKYNGYGVEVLSTGDTYKGEYQNGEYDGEGVLTFANRDKYIGKFENGKYHGRGVLLFAKGSKYTGMFKNDNYNGLGVFIYQNGNKYIGEFKDSKREGQGTFTFADGRKDKGIWKKDKLIQRD